MNKGNYSYAFILGREREIALAELQAVLGRFCFGFNIISVSGNVAILKIDRPRQDVARLIEVLGGTVKIFQLVPVHSKSHSEPTRQAQGKPREESGVERHRLATGVALSRSFVNTQDDKLIIEIINLIATHCKNAQSKFNFGISDYTNKIDLRRLNDLGIEIKKELKNQGRSSRFVALREGKELSTIQTLKNNLDGKGIEVGLFDCGPGVLIGLSNPEEWSERDFGKPAGDRYSGMVPPKLARMMINLAVGQAVSNDKCQMTNKSQFSNSKRQNSLDVENSNFICNLEFGNCDFHDCVVVDPFCGSGNILMEALMLGCKVTGSDISEKSVRDTKANIEWLIQKSNLKNQNNKSKIDISQADATSDALSRNLSLGLGNYDRIAIVTEPYLGQPKKFKSSMNSAMGEYSKIREIYLGFFNNFKQLTATANTKQLLFCVIFPLIETFDKGQYSLYKESVDEIKSLGYTQVRDPLIYGRDYQVVKREIVFLQIQKSNVKMQN